MALVKQSSGASAVQHTCAVVWLQLPDSTAMLMIYRYALTVCANVSACKSRKHVYIEVDGLMVMGNNSLLGKQALVQT